MTATTPQQTAPTWDSLAAQFQSFVTGVLSLDPQQAAIRGGLSILVFIGAALLLWGLRLLLKTLVERLAPADPNAPPHKHAGIGRWSMRFARLAIFVAAILVVLRVWGFDLEQLTKGPVGEILAVGGRIILILVLALAGIEISQIAIRQVFNRVAHRAKNIRRASQLRTVAPLLSGVSTTTFIVVASMMALSEVGVEIGPLLAGAGIVGVAVGFGAQTIVKDFLTGIFLILEDAVSVGDVVRIGDFGGSVEEMSLRTIKLRDFDGTLHIFPYSEAQVIHNRTRGFSFAVFELNLSHDANISKALDLMKQTGDTLRSEDAFCTLILAPIEVVGVDKLSDAGVLLKARIKTAPGKQWAITREYNRRIKEAFSEAHVDFNSTQLKLITPDVAAFSGDPRG